MMPIIHVPKQHGYSGQVNQIELGKQGARQFDTPKRDQNKRHKLSPRDISHPTPALPNIHEKIPIIPHSHQQNYAGQVKQREEAAQCGMTNQGQANHFPTVDHHQLEVKGSSVELLEGLRQHSEGSPCADNAPGRVWVPREKAWRNVSEPYHQDCNAEEEYNPLDIANFGAPPVKENKACEKVDGSSFMVCVPGEKAWQNVCEPYHQDCLHAEEECNPLDISNLYAPPMK